MTDYARNLRAVTDYPTAPVKLVSAEEYRRLLVSHRHMVRIDRVRDHLRGLRDLESGEIFFTDSRRLFATSISGGSR
jgi:hypothetical protein